MAKPKRTKMSSFAKRRLAFLFVTILCSLKVRPIEGRLITTCPEYAQENSVLVCECVASPPVASATFAWPPYSNTSTLRIHVNKTTASTPFTCMMLLNGQFTYEIYQLKIAYGPSPTSVTIVGPGILVTNGSKSIELTCNVQNVVPGVLYDWTFFGPPPNTRATQCESQPAPDKCVIRPQPGDDGGKVMCTATNNITTPTMIRADAFYTLNISYPPPMKPVITIAPHTEPLKKGDVIKCVVTGGKPPVTDVNLRCSHPEQGTYTVKVNGDTVTSSVIVDTQGATKELMVCSCRAPWEPFPQYYDGVTYASFSLEYVSETTNFTINDKSDVTVNEKDNVTLAMTCQGEGRPAPTMRIAHNNATVSPRPAGSKSTNTTGDTTVLDLNLGQAVCEDSGDYTCYSDNGEAGRGSSITKSARVNVTCQPTDRDSAFSGGQVPQIDPGSGLAITLRSNPPPNKFTAVFHRSSLNLTRTCGYPDLYSFNFNCSPNKENACLAVCHINTTVVPEECLGVFNAELSNAFGEFNFQFAVNKPVIPRTENNNVNMAACGKLSLGGSLAILFAFLFALGWKP